MRRGGQGMLDLSGTNCRARDIESRLRSTEGSICAFKQVVFAGDVPKALRPSD